jgi:hypothetical protein
MSKGLVSLAEMQREPSPVIKTEGTVDNQSVAVKEVVEEDEIGESEKGEERLSMLISPDSERDGVEEEGLGLGGSGREGGGGGGGGGEVGFDKSFDFIVDGARF